MNKKIIVALDLDNIEKAIKIVKELKKEVYAFKIGHEFFYTFGLEGYKKIYEICPKIFLDLKLHDIPNTVQKGLKAISKLNPIFTTIHISGGDEMQKISTSINNKKTNILGVTVLTSLYENQTPKYYKDKHINLSALNFLSSLIPRINKIIFFPTSFLTIFISSGLQSFPLILFFLA